MVALHTIPGQRIEETFKQKKPMPLAAPGSTNAAKVFNNPKSRNSKNEGIAATPPERHRRRQKIMIFSLARKRKRLSAYTRERVHRQRDQTSITTPE
jgi:hypothetical protein